jgi:uncharacterized protein with PIN domain
MGENRTLICHKCQVELTTSKTHFDYLGHSFHADMLRCPKCGQIFIPEELVKGRMAEVEMMMEDK